MRPAISQAASQAEVDRSTIIRLRQVAKDGALTALAASKPGAADKSARDVELEQAHAQIEPLSEVVKELAANADGAQEEGAGGVSVGAPVPARVDARVKQGLPGGGGLRHWPGMDLCPRPARSWDWTCAGLAAGGADGGPAPRPGWSTPGAGASVNALTPPEVEAILEAFETSGRTRDFSHRRLAPSRLL